MTFFLIRIHHCLYMEHVISSVLNVFIYLLYRFDIVKGNYILKEFSFSAFTSAVISLPHITILTKSIIIATLQCWD